MQQRRTVSSRRLIPVWILYSSLLEPGRPALSCGTNPSRMVKPVYACAPLLPFAAPSLSPKPHGTGVRQLVARPPPLREPATQANVPPALRPRRQRGSRPSSIACWAVRQPGGDTRGPTEFPGWARLSVRCFILVLGCGYGAFLLARGDCSEITAVHHADAHRLPAPVFLRYVGCKPSCGGQFRHRLVPGDHRGLCARICDHL